VKAVKISIILPKEYSRSLLEDLFALGLRNIFVELGRNSLLDKGGSIRGLLSRKNLQSYPVEIVSFFALEDHENSILSYFAKKYDLRTPGRGTIYSQNIDILNSHQDYGPPSEIHFRMKHQDSFFKQLAGVSCIVQRGEGDVINRISLNYGASVPATTFGEGSGARDKLGLIRVTIPPEKEIINLVLSKHDLNPVMELVISQGKLDQPGRGIAYVFAVKQGIINTKIARSGINQVASVEQMVSAIDSLKGGMEWRKSILEYDSLRRRDYLISLSELNLVCEEGVGTKLTEAAMSSGAPGATICKIRFNSLDENLELRRNILEVCKMIVPSRQVPAINNALAKTGCFDNDAKAMLYAVPVEKAFTYRAKEIKK